MLEARQTLPVVGGVTAPALPLDCSMHILTVAELNMSTPPSGKLMLPPAALGYVPDSSGADPLQPVPADTAWGRYVRQMSCVCGKNRFWQDYQTNGIYC